MLTARTLYYLLGNTKHRWHDLGMNLHFSDSELAAIEAQFEAFYLGRRMIELFDLYIKRDIDCNWPTVITALNNMGEEDLALKVAHYTKELQRIQMKSPNKYSRRLMPMKEYCYEDWQLEQQYFDNDNLARTLREDSKTEIVECLKNVVTKWYEIGFAMHVPKVKLDSIEQDYRYEVDPIIKLTKMIDVLVNNLKITWRMFIDTLMEMNLSKVALSIESLASNKYQCSLAITPIRLDHREYRRSDFAPKICLEKLNRTKGNEEVPYEDKQCQKCIKKIRDILQLPTDDISDEDVLDDLYKHIVNKNPSQEKLQVLTNVVEEVSDRCSRRSKELEKDVKRLREDMATVNEVRNTLSQQKVKLEVNKGKLENDSEQINDKIEVIKKSDQKDRKTDELMELERGKQLVEEQLQEICKELNDCIVKLKKANADYDSINEELKKCRINLDKCRKQHKRCREYITEVLGKRVKNVQSGQLSSVGNFSWELLAEIKMGEHQDKFQFVDIPLSFEIRTLTETITESLTGIDETETMIVKTQKKLSLARHPYANEMKLPDPSKCEVTGKGLEVAAAGEKTTVVLQAIDFNGKICDEKISPLECKLVSMLKGTKAEVSVERREQGKYEIKYHPTTKGIHQLSIKVKGQHIRRSPFSLAVTSPVEQLGTPILSIGGMEPTGIAINQRGEVVVTRWCGNYVFVLSPSGEKLRSFETHSCNEIKIHTPYRVAVDGMGNILVADYGNHRIQKFTSEGQFITAVGSQGNGPLQLSYPTGIAYNHSNDKVYVIDKDNRVLVLNSDLTFSGAFGRKESTSFWKSGRWKKGSSSGHFDNPFDITCDSTGKVYVADRDNYRIQVFEANGEFLRKFGRRGEGRGELNSPIGIAVDTSGLVYVSECTNHRVSVFTSEGRFLTCFGRKGMKKGEFRYPIGLAVDSSGVVYVCDQDNNRIQVL